MTRRWFFSQSIAWIGLVTVVSSLLWAMAPPSVIPPAPLWVEDYVSPLLQAALLGLIATGLIRRTIPRVVGWTALAFIAGALALQALFFAFTLFVTFPANF
ncbi:hypothetical protein AB3X52_00865 [Nocardioides sp. DS6]|uniref:Uncharacterized protein n=1 Tax=Nocardioides eburneus TaxID=3231482 RepID=A0ABV3SUX1_9ACTN